MDESRYINIKGQTYYLEEKESINNPCILCALKDECDYIADEFNKIEYQLCLQLPYSLNHSNVYFKKV